MEKPIDDAIYLLGRLSDINLEGAKGMRNTIKDWTSDAKDLAETTAQVCETTALCLIKIKEMLENRQPSTKKTKSKKRD